MKTLHIAPGRSAGGSLLGAIRDAGRDDEVLPWPDDLSCGPIATGEPSERAEWWAPFCGDGEVETELKSFWDRIEASSDRLIVWFGRHSASELAFSLAWADRLDKRPYDIIDVTGTQFAYKRPDGSSGRNVPMQSAGMMLARLVALVDEGKLLACGDPWNMRSCEVRLPS